MADYLIVDPISAQNTISIEAAGNAMEMSGIIIVLDNSGNIIGSVIRHKKKFILATFTDQDEFDSLEEVIEAYFEYTYKYITD